MKIGESMTVHYTYVLENPNALPQRRYYVGRTNNITRRMNEHLRDKYKNYKLIWFIEGNYERKIKDWGATRWMEIIHSGILNGGTLL